MPAAEIAKIATEAIKPFSSVLDALLGPKLKRIRNWVEEQDVKNHLGKPVINDLIDEYIRRLLRRICGISTIVFPQYVLPLTDIYEPLKLSEYSPNAIDQKSQFNTDMLQEGHNFLIVDSAGMGKSTFAKHFILEILEFTPKIPIFFELRRIGETESLLGRLCLEMDETKKDIDEKLLLRLFALGNFVIILDGYDETPMQIREQIGRQITELAVRCHNNSFILTARPEVHLPELPESKVFKIRPLNSLQAKSLVHRYDTVANIDVGERLISEFHVVPKRFLETPLLVALLYRTFGFNNSIAARISSFYDEMYNALYKGHDLTKAGFSRPKSSQLDIEDFRRLLRGFSFLLLVHQKDSLKSETESIAIMNESVKLTSIQPSSTVAFFNDLLVSVPLLIKDGTDFRFIHKSICEFFAAEFLAYHPQPEQIIMHLTNEKLVSAFQNIFEYLADISPSLFRRSIVAPLAEKALAAENPMLDPYIRSLRFLRVEICFKLTSERIYNPTDILNVLQRSQDSTLAIGDVHGTLEGREYYLTIAIPTYDKWSIRPLISPSVWELLTIEENFEEIVDKHFNFDDLEGLVQEKWISMYDKRILRHSCHAAIAHLLKKCVRLFDGVIRMKLSSLTDTMRVLNENECKKILRDIQQERETQNWLTGLLSDSA